MTDIKKLKDLYDGIDSNRIHIAFVQRVYPRTIVIKFSKVYSLVRNRLGTVKHPGTMRVCTMTVKPRKIDCVKSVT